MSLDLFQEGINERLSQFRPIAQPEVGIFDNFLAGTGRVMMQGFAEAGRAIDLAGAAAPITYDAINGGTTQQDRYFKEHDEVFGGAVKHWAPEPGEVGVAGQVVGRLLSMLPMVIASPPLAVGATGLAVAEDLAAKGVSPTKATAVGLTQAAGLGLGIWMPILGATGWQRIVLGGAGFNLVQGVATRGASGAILTDTPAAEDFKAFDPEMLTLDVLLGAAFGTLAHLSPKQRAQGDAAWERIRKWGRDVNPSEVDAIAALRQAQHLNVDSMGGKPADLPDIEAHVNRMRTALDQFARGEPINVESLTAPKVEADGRFVEAEKQTRTIVREADAARKANDLPAPDDLANVPETVAPKAGAAEKIELVTLDEFAADLKQRNRAIIERDIARLQPLAKGVPSADEARLPIHLRTDESSAIEQITQRKQQLAELDARYSPESVREVYDALKATGKLPEALAQKAEPDGEAAKAPTDPLAAAADRFVADNGDLLIRVGEDARGEPVTVTPKKYLELARAEVEKARQDVPLFEAAARCLFGGGA